MATAIAGVAVLTAVIIAFVWETADAAAATLRPARPIAGITRSACSGLARLALLSY